jgi:hypothetical protein
MTICNIHTRIKGLLVIYKYLQKAFLVVYVKDDFTICRCSVVYSRIVLVQGK